MRRSGWLSIAILVLGVLMSDAALAIMGAAFLLYSKLSMPDDNTDVL